MWSGSGTYYYTGTGSVANIVAGSGTRGYSYGPGGSVTVYGQGSLESRTNTQAACYGYNGEYTHGSLELQYLRARYLKVETGTFTSRDTYAGRVRDILSQNRYTYAEKNPVTFADPSGHKITFVTMMRNMFGGGRNTGRNGGIGALMENTAPKLMELELTYFLQSCEEDQWAPTTKYNCPAEVSFGDYVANTGNYNAREMASIFQGTYEKSTEEDSYEKRENWAEGWYNHFTGVEDIRECYKKYDY